MPFDLELKFLTYEIIAKDVAVHLMTDWVTYRKIDGLHLKKKKWKEQTFCIIRWNRQ